MGRSSRGKIGKQQVFGPESTCRALVWVDPEPLLRWEQQRRQEFYARLADSQRFIELHETEDVQAFEHWFYASFGQQITQLRALYRELEEAETIIRAVEDLVAQTGWPEQVAYERVLFLKEQLKEQGNEAGAKDRQSSADGCKNHHHHEQDADNQEHSGTRQEKKQAKAKKTLRSPDFTKQLKMAYRELAKKLHPDLNPSLTARQREMWHAVQQAYAAGDSERLETLMALTTADHHADVPKPDDLAVLRRQNRSLERSVWQLERKIQVAKQNPAWGFKETSQDPSRLAGLTQKVRSELTKDHRSLKGNLRQLSSIIDSWLEPVHPKSRKSKRDHRRSMDW